MDRWGAVLLLTLMASQVTSPLIPWMKNPDCDQAPVKNWKHRVFVRGNQLLDNIEFEEWSLKGLDKDLGPELWPLKTEGSRSQDTSVAQQEEDPKRQGVVSLSLHSHSPSTRSLSLLKVLMLCVFIGTTPISSSTSRPSQAATRLAAVSRPARAVPPKMALPEPASVSCDVAVCHCMCRPSVPEGTYRRPDLADHRHTYRSQ